jgi:hypothetical protein
LAVGHNLYYPNNDNFKETFSTVFNKGQTPTHNKKELNFPVSSIHKSIKFLIFSLTFKENSINETEQSEKSLK